MSVLLCVGKVHLLRHSEGSAWVAVVEVRQIHIAFNRFSLLLQELQIIETSPQKREEILYEG